jgi:TRAP-type mannitol/chloroaromatic compound transport system permease large subunit
MKGVAPPEITMRQVWAAAFPYTVIVFGVLMLVVFVPSVAHCLREPCDDRARGNRGSPPVGAGRRAP